MPRGVYVRPTGKVHCKRCQDTPGFKSVSELRKHQWSEHRDYYANVSKMSLKKARIAKALKRDQREHESTEQVLSDNHYENLPLVKVNHFSPRHEMTVSEVIRVLETRHIFMGDVIALLKGLQNGG